MRDIPLYWGHELITPDGRAIRVPSYAFATLRRLGLLTNNKNKLSPMIYEYLRPEYDPITDDLRRMLGKDLEGPRILKCYCGKCRREGKPSGVETVDQAIERVKAGEKIRIIIKNRTQTVIQSNGRT